MCCFEDAGRKLPKAGAALSYSSQRDAKKTPYVIEGSNVNSSIIIKVENDVVLYCKAGTRKLRAQIRVLGNEFHLPVSSIAVNEMFEKTKKETLTLKQDSVDFIRVSLARPFLPWMSSHLDTPRCYAMLTGIVLSNKVM